MGPQKDPFGTPFGPAFSRPLNRLTLTAPALTLLLCLANAFSASATHPAVPWRTPNARTTTRFDLSHNKPDTGLVARIDQNEPTSLHLSLAGADYSHTLLTDAVPYHESDLLLLDLPELKNGSLTLQAVGLDPAGHELEPVDLLKDITDPGTYELPLRIYRTPLKGAKTVTFQLWFSGGKDATATVNTLALGTAK